MSDADQNVSAHAFHGDDRPQMKMQVVFGHFHPRFDRGPDPKAVVALGEPFMFPPLEILKPISERDPG